MDQREILVSKSTLDIKSFVKMIVVCFIPVTGIIIGGIYLQNSVLLILGLTMIFFPVFGFIYTPYRIVLTESHLILYRHIGNILIPIQQITTIRLFNPVDRKGIFRTFGAEGVFGNWGLYKSAAHKRLYVYTRRGSNWTLIITPNKKYVIAPNDLKLIDVAQEQMKKVDSDASSDQIQAEIQEYSKRRLLVPKITGIIVFIIVLFNFLFLYFGFKDPHVNCTSTSFEIRRMWGMSLMLSEVDKIDTIAWKDMPHITLRTDGISLLGVNRGSFKTKNEENIRLSVKCGISPVIRIEDKEGKLYYVNRKNPEETRDIYQSLINHHNNNKLIKH